MPLPTDGPTSSELVKAHLKVTDDIDDAAIDAAVDAVNDMVRELPICERADTDPAPSDWTGPGLRRITHGATLLAARVFRRRNTPDGIAAFGDGGTAYVQRNDPDVAQLLQIGNYTKPSVG
jgi:hypothetical protein